LFAVMAMVLAGCVQPEPIAPADAGGDAAASSDSAASSGSAATGNEVPGGVYTTVSSADASILNPILWSDSASSGVGRFLFPVLIGADPFTGETVP
ncbi:MAG: hypothetical protein KDE54_29335, partial [Caldilineaceae bacterium]|nr:hypothetical protein [Caldilineaceae bacterium]